MEDPEVLVVANEISGRHGLRASFLEGARSVGVQGDAGSYTRVILLEGQFPGHEALAEISTEISNRTGINRITFDIPAKRFCD